MQISPLLGSSEKTLPFLGSIDTRRDLFWGHCRNALGIARLLEREGRPRPMVATACAMAMEMACRAALEHAGHPFDGSLERALDRLGAPGGWAEDSDGWTHGGVDTAERVVAWVAGYLKRQVPERSWGY